MDLPLQQQQAEDAIVMQLQIADGGEPSPRPRRGAPVGLTLYDNLSDKQRLSSAENDLKFVLYMYEVRKMRDIYGRIVAALEIIKDKKSVIVDHGWDNQLIISKSLQDYVLRNGFPEQKQHNQPKPRATDYGHSRLHLHRGEPIRSTGRQAGLEGV